MRKEDEFNFMFIVFVEVAYAVTDDDNNFIKMYWVGEGFIEENEVIVFIEDVDDGVSEFIEL